jgi:hypothetical protein
VPVQVTPVLCMPELNVDAPVDAGLPQQVPTALADIAR